MGTVRAHTNSLRAGARICHVISGDLWGGAEAQALGLLQGLAGRAQVCAVVFNRGELCSRLEASGIAVEWADEKALGFLALVFRMRSIFKTWRPDLIHVHGFKENGVAGVAARSLAIPVVRTHHGRGMLGARRRYTYLERFNAAFLTDGLIAVSEDLSRFLRLKRLSLGKLRIIRNGIKGHAAHAKGASRKSAEHRRAPSFTIGTVGRLVAVKNHRCLLEAFKYVCEEIGSARLIIVGDGPLATQLESQAVELGISEKLLWAGFQQDVGHTLNSLDVFVLSSLHEGVPMSLLEAMSMGIPVVCTRVGGIPEVITDHHNGLLVDCGDAKALSAAIKKIAGDPSLAQRLAAHARATVADEFSFDRCLANTVSLYGELVSK